MLVRKDDSTRWSAAEQERDWGDGDEPGRDGCEEHPGQLDHRAVRPADRGAGRGGQGDRQGPRPHQPAHLPQGQVRQTRGGLSSFFFMKKLYIKGLIFDWLGSNFKIF